MRQNMVQKKSDLKRRHLITERRRLRRLELKQKSLKAIAVIKVEKEWSFCSKDFEPRPFCLGHDYTIADDLVDILTNFLDD